MTGGRTRLWAGLVAFAALWVPANAAGAANSPTFRDCSHVFGVDPDFIQLTGATLGSDGKLTVPSSQAVVTLKASESSIPGDNLNKVSFSVTVSGTGSSAKTISGTGIGHVTLSVPLTGVAAGGQYSLDWSAVFDGGTHRCPGPADPQNPASSPFVLSVVSGPASQPPAITSLRESHRSWRQGAGTRFSLTLNEPASLTLRFRQRVHGRLVTRGSLMRSGAAGPNKLRFNGRIPGRGRLTPGRYVLTVTAATSAGQQSAPASISFVIRPRSARRA
ncbi:MAG TPA: hypothetical protein VJU80_17000 [Solirubrobacteraceae bacterium]|nr:hypothetical protein [Solirubrobacteraceae bacterium]